MAPNNRYPNVTGVDPFCLHTGNIKVKPGQSARNAIGAGENALLLAVLVKKLVEEGNATLLSHQACFILETMGGCDGLYKSVTTLKAEQAPEPKFSSIDSVIRDAHNSFSSASGRFNDSSSVRKRRATGTPEPNSDDELAMFDEPLGRIAAPIPVISRTWPATPYIVADSIISADGRKDVFSLTAADECMIFTSKEAARIFGELLIDIRKKVSESMPLSAAAQMAGIDKSLVLSFDMPLYLPKLDSTAVASYVGSITNIKIFTNEAETRRLARETIHFMQSQNWQPATGPAIQYERLFTPAKGFVPIEVVADKLTHLGRAFKPLVKEQGHTWPQVIAADYVRRLDWNDYDRIGQPPKDNDN